MLKKDGGKDGKNYLIKNSSSKFSKAIRKYGWNDFTHIILGFYREEKLDKMERYWINRFDSYRNGYNGTPGSNLMSMTGKKHSEEAKHKIGLSNGRKVVRFIRLNNTNKFIYEKIYSSAAEAARDIGIFNNSQIIACCKGIKRLCKGYLWRYEDCVSEGEVLELKSKSSSYGMKNKRHSQETINKITQSNIAAKGKIIEQLDLNENLINKFLSISEAVKYLSLKTHSAISNCCRGRRKTAYGYIWRYAEVESGDQ